MIQTSNLLHIPMEITGGDLSELFVKVLNTITHRIHPFTSTGTQCNLLTQ